MPDDPPVFDMVSIIKCLISLARSFCCISFMPFKLSGPLMLCSISYNAIHRFLLFLSKFIRVNPVFELMKFRNLPAS